MTGIASPVDLDLLPLPLFPPSPTTLYEHTHVQMLSRLHPHHLTQLSPRLAVSSSPPSRSFVSLAVRRRARLLAFGVALGGLGGVAYIGTFPSLLLTRLASLTCSSPTPTSFNRGPLSATHPSSPLLLHTATHHSHSLESPSHILETYPDLSSSELDWVIRWERALRRGEELRGDAGRLREEKKRVGEEKRAWEGEGGVRGTWEAWRRGSESAFFLFSFAFSFTSFRCGVLTALGYQSARSRTLKDC